MDLTPENKAIIDARSYQGLLSHWRFAPVGDPWFQGETGKYWGERMKQLREANEGAAVSASKSIGWER
jgi:hypothetical protein